MYARLGTINTVTDIESRREFIDARLAIDHCEQVIRNELEEEGGIITTLRETKKEKVDAVTTSLKASHHHQSHVSNVSLPARR